VREIGLESPAERDFGFDGIDSHYIFFVIRVGAKLRGCVYEETFRRMARCKGSVQNDRVELMPIMTALKRRQSVWP
jgi:hypothetical protein